MIKWLLLISLLWCSTAWAGYKVTGNLEVTGNAGIGVVTPLQRLDVDGVAYLRNNVGIGTSAALTKLEVRGRIASLDDGGGVSGYDGNILDPTSYVDLAFDNDLNDYGGFWLNGSANSNSDFYSVSRQMVIDASSPTGLALLSEDGAIYFVTGGSAFSNERMRITSTGNVGIGTSVPRAKLDVEGTVYMKGNVGIGTSAPNYNFIVKGSGTANLFSVTSSVGSNLFNIDNGTGNTSLNAGGGEFQVGGGSGARFVVNSLTTTKIAALITGSAGQTADLLQVKTGTADGNAVFIKGSGNVGINTSAPVAKLEVEGSVYFGTGNVGIGSVSPLGKLEVDGNIYIPAANLTRGYSICWSSAGIQGHCTSIVGVDGSCTCVSN